MAMMSYVILYISFFLPSEHFVTMTVLYGVILGLSIGMSQMVINITPLAWLEKKRAQWIPFLFLGAGAGAVFAAPLITWMISEYSYRYINTVSTGSKCDYFRGTALLLIGIMSHQLIFSNFFMSQPDYPLPKNRFGSIHPTKNHVYRLGAYLVDLFGDIKSADGLYVSLALSVTLNAFISSPIITQATNIMTENGITERD